MVSIFRYDEIEENISRRKQELELYYEHRGRRARFSSPDERNAWLRENIIEWEKTLELKKQQSTEIQNE